MTDTLYLKEKLVEGETKYSWFYTTNSMSAESTDFTNEDKMIEHFVGVFREELFDETKLVVEATEAQRDKILVEYQKQFGVVDIPTESPVDPT